MTRPYSMDLRVRAVALVEAGQSRRAVARLLGLGEATVIRWLRRQTIFGTCAAKPMGGDRHSHRTETHATLILQVLENRSQAYLREVRASLQEHGAVVSLSGLSRFFRRHGISRKKGICTPPSKAART